MAKETDEDLRGDIDATLKAMVRGGFAPRDEIWLVVDDICEQGDEPDTLRAYASAELELLWREQRADEASWSGSTDCDRLDRAFDDLEDRGIICRHDFTCCGNCGVAEIGAELNEAEQRGTHVRGYAFYHQQDTEAAVNGHGVYLNYGAEKEGEAAALAIAREIITTLKHHGLDPQWNGSIGQRIHVPLVWRRRLACT
ncbi:MAG: hypothetical protein R3C27_05425 [Hyphomonadaceae bacterium]